MITRRHFLGTTAAATASLLAPRSRGAEPYSLSFFVIGNTHYLANAEKRDELDPLSAATNAGLIETLNRLRGTAIPEDARAGNVGEPRGIIHVGDLSYRLDLNCLVNVGQNREVERLLNSRQCL